ncbi:MAG TPA: hypothetical protein VGD58_27345 [Herpetosiphonaceae bacterium]
MPTPVFSTERNVYYHSFRWLFLLGATFSFAVLLYQLIAGRTIILVVLYSYLTVYMFALGVLTRIETSASGISYHNMGLYSIQTSWDNVAGVKNLPLRFLGDTRCIVLRQPAAHGWTNLAIELPRAERERIIPLPIHGAWARIEALENDIRRYTGHEVL